MATVVHDGAARLPPVLPHGLPSTQTLIEGRREAGEQLFEVHDRYTSSRADGMSYGGVKESGFGREGPRYAIREMTDEKVITVSL